MGTKDEFWSNPETSDILMMVKKRTLIYKSAMLQCYKSNGIKNNQLDMLIYSL